MTTTLRPLKWTKRPPVATFTIYESLAKPSLKKKKKKREEEKKEEKEGKEEKKKPQKATWTPVDIAVYNQEEQPEMYDFARAKLAWSLASENPELCLRLFDYEMFLTAAPSLWKRITSPKATIFLAFGRRTGRFGQPRKSRNVFGLLHRIQQMRNEESKEKPDPKHQLSLCKELPEALEEQIEYQQRQVIGFAVCDEGVAWHKQRAFEIELLCSSEGERGVGISLLEAVRQYAEGEKYEIITLKAVQQSVEYYDKQGFVVSRGREAHGGLTWMQRSTNL